MQISTPRAVAVHVCKGRANRTKWYAKKAIHLGPVRTSQASPAAVAVPGISNEHPAHLRHHGDAGPRYTNKGHARPQVGMGRGSDVALEGRCAGWKGRSVKQDAI